MLQCPIAGDANASRESKRVLNFASHTEELRLICRPGTHHLVLLPPPKEGGYVFAYVCLSVCLCGILLKKL